MPPSLTTDRTIAQLFERYHFLWKAYFPKDGPIEGFDSSVHVESAGRQKQLLDINWLSFSDLEENRDHLSVEQYENIKAIFCKARHLENHKLHIVNSVSYVGAAMLSVLSDFEYGSTICRCGCSSLDSDANLPCSKWKYCERCANHRRRYMWSKYASSCETKHNKYLITITKTEKVKFVEGNYETIIHDWNDMNNYADSLIKEGGLVGGIRAEEVAFDTYYPHTIANPHIHILCHGKFKLQSHEYNGMKIDVKRIKDDLHWVNSLNYLNKSIDFVTPYTTSWTKENANIVNRNLRETMGAHKYVINNRNQVRAFGSFHGKSKACENADIKIVRRNKKSTLQKTPEKIEYSEPMFEDFKAGVESRITTKLPDAVLKVAYVGLTTPPAQKPKSPWYKNPLVLGGGALAGAAGLYAGGKMYNGGDNAVNNTFGAGIDKYVVDPIKGLFNKPTPPTNTGGPDAGTAAMIKAQRNLFDRQVELSQSKAELTTAAGNPHEGATNGLPGTKFSDTSIEDLNAASNAVGRYNGLNLNLSMKDKPELLNPDNTYKQDFLDIDKSLNTNRLYDTIANRSTGPSGFEGGVRKAMPLLNTAMLGGMGINVSDALLKGTGNAASKFFGVASKGTPYLFGVGDAVGGYQAAKDNGGNPWLHAGNAALAGAASGFMRPGPMKIPAMVTSALAYPSLNQLSRIANDGHVESMSTLNRIGSQENQLMGAIKEYQTNKNDIPMRALMESDWYKNVMSDPGRFTNRYGAPGADQYNPSTVGIMMWLKQKGLDSLLGNKLKDIVAQGKTMIPRQVVEPDYAY